MKSLVISALILAIFIAPAIAGPGDPALKQAQGLKNSGDLKGAMAAVTQGLALEPDSPGLNSLAGAIYFAQANYDSSLFYYKKALEKKGKDPDALYGAGMSALKLKSYDEALNYFQQGEKTGKNKAKFYYGMGLAQMEKADYQNADLNFRKAIDKDKKNAEYHMALAEVNYRNKVYSIAISEYSRAIELDSTIYYQNLKVHFQIAQSYLNMRNVPQAIEEYKVAVQLHPQDTTAWMELARIYDISGNTAQAVFSYEKYLAIASGDGQAWFDLGKLYLKIPDQAKAAEAFEKAISLKSNESASYGFLAKIYSDRKEFEKAFDAFNRYEATFGAPDSAEYWVEKGKVLMKLGEKNPIFFDSALTAFNRTLMADSNYSAAYEYAGLTQYYKKNYSDAIRYFLRKIALDSTSINTYRNLAFAYLKTDQYSNAARAFAKALELKPDDVIMRSLLAKIYSVDKNFQNSVTQYEYILSNDKGELTDSLRCEIYPDLGSGYLQLQNYQAALQTLIKAEKCKPNDFTILMNLAAANEYLDKVSDAHNYYKRALEIRPSDKEAKKGSLRTQIQGRE